MILSYNGKKPIIADNCYIAPTAAIIGNVQIGERSSVWFGTVLRGDINYIRVGRYTNLQDNVVAHVDHGEHPARIGDYVTVGHGAILHGCTIEDTCVIGISSIVLDGAVIGQGSIVAAGSIVRQNQTIPPGVFVAGNPAVVKRETSQQQRQDFKQWSLNYSEYPRGYL